MVQRFDGEAVGVEAEAADDTLAGCRDEGMVAELFTLMDIGDVHLDDGALQRADAVLNPTSCILLMSSPSTLLW